jgi:Ca2+-binding RTX toxin-like protein
MLVYGTSASETLSATAAADVILGLEGHDILLGLDSADTLIGGAGSDTLTGGTGADMFVVDIAPALVQGGTSSFVGWLDEMGVQVPPVGSITQGQFSSAYTQWLSHLVATYNLGTDVNADGVIGVDINQNDPFGTPLIEGMTQQQLNAMFGDRVSVDVTTGATMHTRYFSDSFSVGTTTQITGSSGTDLVLDFSRAQGDKLAIAGATAADLARPARSSAWWRPTRTAMPCWTR